MCRYPDGSLSDLRDPGAGEPVPSPRSLTRCRYIETTRHAALTSNFQDGGDIRGVSGPAEFVDSRARFAYKIWCNWMPAEPWSGLNAVLAVQALFVRVMR